MSISDLVFRPPVTIEPPTLHCPKHGDMKGFTSTLALHGKNFCLLCIRDKMEEIGICEVTTKEKE